MIRAALLVLALALPVGALAAPAERLLEGVGFEQRIGARLPLAAVFRDASGRTVTLGRYFHGRPVALVLAYYGCPNLCGTVLGELAARLSALDLVAGRDFEVVVVSFDPSDTPQAARAKQSQYGARWHFLTADAATIGALTRSVGFRYARDRDADAWIHPSGVVLAAPDGTVSRYVFALDPDDPALRYGLIAASEYRLASATDRLWLLCHSYDPASGRYSSLVGSAERGVGLASVLALAGVVGWCARRRRR